MSDFDSVAFCEAIAKLLGGAWSTHDPTERGERRRWFAYLVFGGPFTRTFDCPTLGLSYDAHAKRVRVSADWPIDPARNTHYRPSRDDAVPAITVSPSRSLEAIKADIVRRIITPYLELCGIGDGHEIMRFHVLCGSRFTNRIIS